MSENLFRKRLIEIMKLKNIRQVDLVKNTGIAKSSISQYLKGVMIPKQDKIYLLAKYLNVNPVWLWGLSDDMNIPNNNIIDTYNQLNYDNQTKVLNYSIDLLERQNNTNNSIDDNVIKEQQSLYKVRTYERLSAGVGYAYGDNETEDYYTDRKDFKAYDLASVVHGNSMVPKYNDGDVVLIRSGYDNTNGGVYAVDYNNESFIKRVFFEGDRIRLVSFNRDYEDIYIYLPVEDGIYLNIIGKVVDSFTPVQVK